MKQTFHHALPFGAEVQPNGTTRFRLWAPTAAEVRLDVPDQTLTMEREPGGWHTIVAPISAGTPYRYLLPDGLRVPDPASRLQGHDVHDPSLVIDPASYTWRNTDWHGRPWHETVLYECHAGIMGGYKGIRARLPDLAKLGVTAIELMPLSDVPGPRNWGYDGVLPFAPDSAHGHPDELKAMIDDAHGLGLMVFLDVVYNHFGPDGDYLHAYAKPFFRDDIKTPWGAAIDFRRREVREYFTQNAIYWINEYRFDGLRFDAVHMISEESFLIELAPAIRAAAGPGRHVHLVLEHEDNRAALLRHTAESPLFDAQWADDTHHCLHVLLTGDDEGYYADFQNADELLVTIMQDGFAYQGQQAPHLDRPRGEPSGHLPTTAFVICLQNHDQIGNRALGERLTMLAPPDGVRAAMAFMLLSPFIPMLFMGEEWASITPFLFFTSHNDDLAKLVDEGRSEEFKSFAAFKDPARRVQIPAPNDLSTYKTSVPAQTDPSHADWIAALLRLRAKHIVPGLPGARSLGARVMAPGAVRGEWRLGTGETLTITLNLGAETLDTEPSGRLALFASPGATPESLPPRTIVVTLA